MSEQLCGLQLRERSTTMMCAGSGLDVRTDCAGARRQPDLVALQLRLARRPVRS